MNWTQINERSNRLANTIKSMWGKRMPEDASEPTTTNPAVNAPDDGSDPISESELDTTPRAHTRP